MGGNGDVAMFSKSRRSAPAIHAAEKDSPLKTVAAVWMKPK